MLQLGRAPLAYAAPVAPVAMEIPAMAAPAVAVAAWLRAAVDPLVRGGPGVPAAVAARRTPAVRPQSPSPCLALVTVVVALAARRQLLEHQVPSASWVPDCLGAMNREASMSR